MRCRCRGVEVLDGNVGYLQITAFYRADEGTETLETAMNFVSHTDALILDLRNNGGGSPDTAIQLLSYFFRQPNLPLFSIIPRSGEQTIYTAQAAGGAYRDESRASMSLYQDQVGLLGKVFRSFCKSAVAQRSSERRRQAQQIPEVHGLSIAIFP